MSARPDEEISNYESLYEDRRKPRVLDIIDIPFLRKKPTGFQTENCLIDPDFWWTFAGRESFDNLQRFLDNPTTLWSNDSESRTGRNDRVSAEAAALMTSSLCLLRVKNLTLYQLPARRDLGKLQPSVRASFSHNGIYYDLVVTDGYIERSLIKSRKISCVIPDSFLTISLGAVFNDGFAYKLVAAIITPKRGQKESADS